MTYSYLTVGRSSDIENAGAKRLYRLLEIFPGALAWSTLLGVVAISYWLPTFSAVFIIIFDLYWLIKTVYLSVHMSSTFRHMRANQKKDWMTALQDLKPTSSQLAGLTWKDFTHLLILPMSTETYEVVRESFQGLAKTSWPLDKMIVVLGLEQRVGESAVEIARKIEQEFGSLFMRFIVTEHPDGIVGEIRGKGSNEAWAGHQSKKVIDELGMPYKSVIVSVFDIDTVPPHDFFACLTWYYMTSPKPLQSSFQPIPIFSNNIWNAPAFARVFAFSTTFWQMIQQARPEQLVTFSSQSIGFQSLVDVGFWQVNVVSEDSQIFWKCLLRYDGNWETIPMYYPVYMDANVAPTFWQTIINQYKQIRRWHFGVENNPYFIYGFIKNKKISRWLKFRHIFNMTEKTHSSATNAIIIFLLGWLPVTIGRGHFGQTVLSYNLPHITQTIMLLAMVGLISSAVISIILLPQRPPNFGKFRYVWMVLQWFLFPINFIFFGAIPALDAQTRLMLGGKYRLGFWITPKSRKIPPTQNAKASETLPVASEEGDTSPNRDLLS